MQSQSDEWCDAEVTVEVWRDYARTALHLPGMALGRHRLTGDWRVRAAELYEAGARYVRITDPVQVCGDPPAQAARSLELIRELTSRGFAVHWIARCDAGCADHRIVGHLFPPVWIFGASNESTAQWRSGYFPCKCVFRKGPGFIEVRDRRFGSLELRTFDDTRILDTIEALIDGVAAERVPADVWQELAGAGLALEQAGHAWWLPMRVYRWPFPAMAV
jgi:hypothetical protein